MMRSKGGLLEEGVARMREFCQINDLPVPAVEVVAASD